MPESLDVAVTSNRHLPIKKEYTWLLWGTMIAMVVIFRVTDLDVFYARDELAIWPWADQFALAVRDGNWTGTLTDSDYPGIPMFWAQTLFLTFKYSFPNLFPNTMIPLKRLGQDRSLPLLAERRLVVGLLVSLQIVVAIWLVQRLFGWLMAVLAAIFMGLEPFGLTEARVVRLEMISAYFAALSVLTYLVYLRGRNAKWVLVSGVMAGLGVSSKTSAGLIVPFIWVLLLLDLFLPAYFTGRPIPYSLAQRFVQQVKNGIIWAGGAIATFWLIWPAMWVMPLAAIRHVFLLGLSQAANRSVWGDKVFFWGQILPGDPGPLFYPVVLAFRTTPLTWIGLVSALLLIGGSVITVKSSKARLPWRVIGLSLLLTYVLLLIVELTLVISKADRFVLIVFPVLNIVSAIGIGALIGWLAEWAGWQSILRRFPQPVGRNIILAGLVLLVLGVQLANTIPAHPYYFTYWNPWAGGGQAAMQLLPMGAGEGIDLAMDFLNAQPHAAEARVVCGASEPWCQRKFVGTTLRSATYVSGEWVTADYATFYISHLQRQNNPPEVVDFFMARDPLYRVDLQGATYVWVYEVPEMGHFAGTWNDLTGLGRLLGYDFGDKTRSVGDTIEATVWWTNMGAGVDNLVLRWVDETGFEWGRVPIVPLPEYASIPPDQGAIVAGSATLLIPAGTPPGLYFLRIGVVEPGYERLLGEFEMPGEADQLAIIPGQRLMDPNQLAISNRVNRPLAASVTLLGYDRPTEVLNATDPTWLTLYWQATSIPAVDYQVSLRLLDSAGQVVAHWEGQPGHNQYPMSHWQNGEIVRDVWALQVPAEIPIGTYHLEISLTDPANPASLLAQVSIPQLQVWPQPLSYEIPKMQAELQANFGDKLKLLGYDLYFDTDGSGGGNFSPVLYWQSLTDFEGSFDLVFTLRNATSDEVVNTWQVPLGSDGAKTFWKSGEVIQTIHQLAAKAFIGGDYHLDISVLDQTSGQLEPVNRSETIFSRIEHIQDKIVVRIADQ